MPKNSYPDWKPPDGLRSSTPRPVRLSGQGIALSLIAGCLILGAFVLGIFLARTVKRETLSQQLLREQSIPADAVVARLWRTGDKANEPRVTYRFHYRDAVYSNSVNAPLSRWRELQVGQTLPIRFVPAQPTISHPVDWPPSRLPEWFPYLMTALVAGMGSMVAVQVARQMRLLAEGQTAPGRMTGVRRTKTLSVLYEFETPDGATIKGRSPVSKRPEEGATLCVLYDPDRPRRNSLYPMQLVRLG
jgi:hypothetical protein